MENQALSRLKRVVATFRTREWLYILLWPLAGLLFIALIWVNAQARIEDTLEEGEDSARSRAVASANSYAQQIRHMVEQIDQIILRAKYKWETQNAPVNLENEKRQGLFPGSHLFHASIYDANGNVVTSTVTGDHQLRDARGLAFFEQQAAACCEGLQISTVGNSRAHGRPVVRFSRRLTQLDGNFGGVAAVSVEPPYLVTFQESAVAGENDFATLRLLNGPVLASRVGERTTNVPIFYRRNPVFPTPDGVKREPAEKFRNNEARFVAWKKLHDYPLVALSGVSVTDAMAPYKARASTLYDVALSQSLLILLFSLGAAYFAGKLAYRRRQTEETQETYRLATDAANEGFYMLRPMHDRKGNLIDFRLEDCNNRAAELIGAQRDDLIGAKVSELVVEGFKEEVMLLARAAQEKGLVEEEVRVSLRSPLRATWIYRRMVKSNAGLALTIRDISEEKEREQILADLANSDSLTKLPNRNWLNGFLPNALKHASTGTGQLAILFIDLDNFKNVNDTLGHEAGDELLVQAAYRLKEAVRASDHVARLGGDEFIIILEHVEIEEDVSRVAKTIIHTINKPFLLSAGTGNAINASIGISVYPQDGTHAETLLKHADIAMYAAKAAGKGRYAFYHTHLSDSLILRLSKERALEEAVENNEFVVYYQPRVGATNGHLTSMEALVRWERPEHGLVYPCEFIDMAEDVGLIVRLGELVTEQVCQQLAHWKTKGLQMVPVSINVSPQQLKSGTLSAFLQACLTRYGIEPRFIEAELTESAVIDRSVVVIKELAALRAMGIKLMIDDFGTGYSSMAQLHRLDVDVLKVDKEFTKALSEGREGLQLFRAIMSMADALDMCVVAEGVETVEEVHTLQSLACDEIQGYIVSEAVLPSEMAKMMVKRYLFSPPLDTVRLIPA